MRLIHAALAASALALMTTPAAQAQASYECSGIGSEERAAAAAVPHTLRLVYAQADGDFLGGVDTVITDSSGAQIVTAQCPGPWVLANLPDGSYRVTATLRGKTVTRNVTVSGARQQEQVIVF